MHKNIVDLHKDFKYRQRLFKDVFDNEKGRLLIDYMKELYDSPEDLQNVNSTYYVLGKRKAIKEIETLVNSEIKKGEEGE
jgi:hypothetical protein